MFYLAIIVLTIMSPLILPVGVGIAHAVSNRRQSRPALLGGVPAAA